MSPGGLDRTPPPNNRVTTRAQAAAGLESNNLQGAIPKPPAAQVAAPAAQVAAPAAHGEGAAAPAEHGAGAAALAEQGAHASFDDQSEEYTYRQNPEEPAIELEAVLRQMMQGIRELGTELRRVKQSQVDLARRFEGLEVENARREVANAQRPLSTNDNRFRLMPPLPPSTPSPPPSIRNDRPPRPPNEQGARLHDQRYANRTPSPPDQGPPRRGQLIEEISDAESLERHRSRRRRPGQIDRWGILYDGDANKATVEEFIFKVEHMQQLHDVSWSTVMGDFHKLLKGKAEEWYWLHLRRNRSPTWSEFKSALTRQFKIKQSDFEVMRQLVERRQKPSEDFDDYVHEMQKIQNRLTKPVDEGEMVKIIKTNMREEIGKILYPMNIETVHQLRHEFHIVKRTFVRKDSTYGNMPPQRFRRNVEEVTEDSGGEEQPEAENEVAELARKLPPKCWKILLLRRFGYRRRAVPKGRSGWRPADLLFLAETE